MLLIAAVIQKTEPADQTAAEPAVLTSAKLPYTYALREDGTVEIVKYTGKEERVVIPGTIDKRRVTRIADNAFAVNNTVKSVELPKSVREIGKQPVLAFGNSSGEKLPAKARIPKAVPARYTASAP